MFARKDHILKLNYSLCLAHSGPQQGCGGYLTSSSGMFGSPDIDMNGKYDSYLNCLWNIAVDPNKAVSLSFTNFDLEFGSSSGCSYDYVKVQTKNYTCHSIWFLNWHFIWHFIISSVSFFKTVWLFYSLRFMMVKVLLTHWLEHTVEIYFLLPLCQPVIFWLCTLSLMAQWLSVALMPPTVQSTVRNAPLL